MHYILIILKIIPCLFLLTASFLVGRLATVTVQFLIGSDADDALDALIAQRDGYVLEVAHCVHVTVVLLDCLFNLVFEERVQVLDLFAC
eukprot:10148639-Ditylum_brightwellii.AAC.1